MSVIIKTHRTIPEEPEVTTVHKRHGISPIKHHATTTKTIMKAGRQSCDTERNNFSNRISTRQPQKVVQSNKTRPPAYLAVKKNNRKLQFHGPYRKQEFFQAEQPQSAADQDKCF
jgi:hypothetical protein